MSYQLRFAAEADDYSHADGNGGSGGTGGGGSGGTGGGGSGGGSGSKTEED